VALTTLDPVPRLLARAREELAASFDFNRPMRVSRAPGRLDAMGGIAEYTGSLVCQATIDRGVAVLLQSRPDRQLQIFSFNLFDEHLPFTFNISIDHLARASMDALRTEFSAPGRRWAGHLAGCLYLLHHKKRIDLNDPSTRGLNIAVLSTIPQSVGLAASAAVEVATMMNLVDQFSLREKLDAMHLAAMCHEVHNGIVGLPGGLTDHIAGCLGEENALVRMICQPHELLPSLALPAGIRFVGINSGVKQNVKDGVYAETRCAAFMGHTIIVNKMREMGQAAGRPLLSDPMRGYLANLDPDDYKRLFRPYLPAAIIGEQFLSNFGPTIDIATMVDRKATYHVQQATDHHVLEAQRVRRFAELISASNDAPSGTREQGILLDKAGHLMYASHLSYTNGAMLGATECDLLVKLVRQREPEGLYGARITAGGSGGTVAVLCDRSDRADAAITQIMEEYEKETGRKTEAFLSPAPGGWHVGTAVV
jgi:L-arabinokinase